MTGTEFINILKSPTSKILIFLVLLVVGTLIVIPLVSRENTSSSIVQETELQPSEKEPIDIDSDIPQFKVERIDSVSGKAEDLPPPVINHGKENYVRRIIPSTSNTEPVVKRPQTPVSVERPRFRNMERSNPEQEKEKPQKIFVLSAAQGNQAGSTENETFLSSRYAPYGRLLDCKLVNTLESNVDGTPLIAVVIQDLWWTNTQGERKLIIPAGTEIHGKMGSCVRNRMMSDGRFVLVWQITSGQVGMELQLNGRVLEKSNQAGDKTKATITDMAAGIPGRVMGNANLNEMLQYTMAFTQGLSAGFQDNKTFDNGSTIVTENDGSTKNALAKAFETLSSVALENITDRISKESYYIRVPAGTEFYLYIEQVTDIEKAAIADTMLNQLEERKLKETDRTADEVEQTSRLHDAIGNIYPKSLQKELKGIR